MSLAPHPPAVSLEAVLNRSWSLFRRNLIIAATPLIVAFAYGLLIAVIVMVGVLTSGIAQPGRAPASVPTSTLALIFGALIVAALFSLVCGIAMTAAVYGMSAAAWKHGTTTLADGLAAARTRSGALFATFVGFIGFGFVVLLLALPTLGLAFIAAPIAIFYLFPAVVAGGRGGFEGFGESFRMVRRFLGTSAIATLILLAIQYAVSFLAYPAIIPLQIAIFTSAQQNQMPHVTPVLIVLAVVGYALVIVGAYAYFGFAALVQTGLYLELRAALEAQPERMPLAYAPGAPLPPAELPPQSLTPADVPPEALPPASD